MSELTLTLIRLGLLALLWLFIFSLAAVLRRDLYGTQVSHGGRRAAPDAQAAGRTGRPNRRARRQGRAAAGAAVAGGGAAAGSAGAAPAGGGTPRGGPRRPTTLTVTEGRLAGTSLPLGRAGVLIGRAPECTLVLDDEFASSRHARIFARPEGWFVEDLGSRNGTFLGGAKLTGTAPVSVGSVLRIGRTILELRG